VQKPLTREIYLRASGLFAVVDSVDYEALAQHRWFAQFHAETDHCYAERTVKISGRYRKIIMHRVIIEAPDGMFVDHIDHDGLNNRRANLRLASAVQNGRNRVKHVGVSRYKGVTYDASTNKWRARIATGDKLASGSAKLANLGSFNSEIEAAVAYDNAAVSIFGEFAYPNFSEFGASIFGKLEDSHDAI
jgi:hypothetical protein